jgi:hypothetical protein
VTQVRVALPAHLRTLAKVGGDVAVTLGGEATVDNVLDALEERYPMLRGTIRDHSTRQRRAYMRYFACGEDISFVPSTQLLPEAVRVGDQSLIVLGAISGG